MDLPAGREGREAAEGHGLQAGEENKMRIKASEVEFKRGTGGDFIGQRGDGKNRARNRIL